MASLNDASSRHDVVVIGAGPAGEAAAELGGSLGYSVALVERDVVGGTVVTSGGAPTKTFRKAAVYLSSFERDARRSAEPSASTSPRMSTRYRRRRSTGCPK
jgi:NAD(P) transhydrogenase